MPAQRAKATLGPDLHDVAAAIGYIRDTWGVEVQVTIKPSDASLSHAVYLVADVTNELHREELNDIGPLDMYHMPPEPHYLTMAMHGLLLRYVKHIERHMTRTNVSE